MQQNLKSASPFCVKAEWHIRCKSHDTYPDIPVWLKNSFPVTLIQVTDTGEGGGSICSMKILFIHVIVFLCCNDRMTCTQYKTCPKLQNAAYAGSRDMRIIVATVLFHEEARHPNWLFKVSTWLVF